MNRPLERRARVGARPLRRAARAALSAVAVTAACAATALAQRPQFGSTLFWESGLINTPTAYVSPLGGDLALNFTRLQLDSATGPLKFASSNKAASYAFSVSTSLYGRAEVGFSILSGDLKGGLFAKMLLNDQTDGIWRTGIRHWLPSVAVGVRNVGPEKGIDRLGTPGNDSLNTTASVYGVATRTFVLMQGNNALRPPAQLAVSVGYGTGMFRDDGGAGKRYANGGTGGVFAGAALQFAPSRFSTFAIIAEHDAWDVNMGAQMEVRGLRASLFLTEVGAGAGKAGSLAYQKVSVGLGWQTNFRALARGDRMASVTEEYTKSVAGLREQIRASETRITALDGQIRALQSAQEAASVAQRLELERMLREEQDALRRLQELLRQREPVKKP